MRNADSNALPQVSISNRETVTGVPTPPTRRRALRSGLTALITAAVVAGCAADATTVETSSIVNGPWAGPQAYLDMDRYPVSPACHAFLLGDVALAPARCFDRVSARQFRVHVHRGHAGMRVQHAEPLPDNDLIWRLELEAEIPNTVAAERAAAPPEVGDILPGVSFGYAPEGEPVVPMAWEMSVEEVTETEIIAVLIAGETGCHGDLGGALLIDGALAGLLTRVLPDGPGHPASEVCNSRYAFERVDLAR